MDTHNTPESALAEGSAPSGAAALAPSPRVRWRQRAAVRDRPGPAAGVQAQAGQAPSPGPHDATHAPADANAHAVLDDADADADVHTNTNTNTNTDTDADTTPDTRIDIAANPIAPEADTTDATAAAPPDAQPQVAPREVELWLLARRAQGATLRLDFELRTALARQVFRRDFVYVSRQLHALEASRRVQGLDRARLNDALATLRQRADTIAAFLARRTGELQGAIDAHGPASARITFARPARFQATIVSPGAHRFLTLLQQADETLARLEMAWLLGLVEPATRSTLVSDCRRALLGFKELACDRRNAVGSLVQALNAQRREDGQMLQERPR